MLDAAGVALAARAVPDGGGRRRARGRRRRPRQPVRAHHRGGPRRAARRAGSSSATASASTTSTSRPRRSAASGWPTCPTTAPRRSRDHALALALTLLRGIPALSASVRAGQWEYRVARPLRRLSTLRFGVVGCGAIGSVAGAARGRLRHGRRRRRRRREPAAPRQRHPPGGAGRAGRHQRRRLPAPRPDRRRPQHLVDDALLRRVEARGRARQHRPRRARRRRSPCSPRSTTAGSRAAGLDVLETEPPRRGRPPARRPRARRRHPARRLVLGGVVREPEDRGRPRGRPRARAATPPRSPVNTPRTSRRECGHDHRHDQGIQRDRDESAAAGTARATCAPSTSPAPSPATAGSVVDVALYRAVRHRPAHLSPATTPAPCPGLVLGHELSGTLADPAGDLPPARRSSSTRCCRAGTAPPAGPAARRPAPTWSLLGIDAPGGAAEQVAVPEGSLVPLPRGRRPRAAAFAEPLAVAVRAVRRSRLALGEDVARGRRRARRASPSRSARGRRAPASVLVVETAPARREMAARLGCVPALRAMRPADRPGRRRAGRVRLRLAPRGRGPARRPRRPRRPRRGRRVYPGLTPLDLQAVTFKELEVIGTRVYSRDDLRTAARMITSGAFDPGRC